MLNITETLHSSDARVERSISFIDLVDSTGLKLNTPEASWLPHYGWFYEVCADRVAAGGAGTIVKLLGDGVMIAYSEDQATQAINDAIAIQEALEDGVEGQHVRLACSIGIATGEVVEFVWSGESADYLGTVVDRAARLSAAASAQAIFVDGATTASARMNRVHSRVGKALRRPIAEYQGETQKAQLKGFLSPVEYHELHWAQQLFGLKSQVLTATIDSAPATASQPAPSRNVVAITAPSRHADRGQRATVIQWQEEHDRGFVQTAAGERFYTDMRYVVGEEPLEVGEVVYFVEQPAPAPEKLRIAAAVIVVDEELTGLVVAALDGFGFLRVTDSRCINQDIYVANADVRDELIKGQRVRFIVGETARGARATDVIPDEGGDALAA
jgi:class 3 adenylate cyclase/cold shock CspA family protein